MNRRDLISSHYANDDPRHFAFVRRSGYTSADFRQEWRPRLRDVVTAVALAVLVLGFALTAAPASDEEIGARMHQVSR